MMVTNKGMTAALRRLKVEKNMKSKIIVDSSANVYQLPDVDFACVPLKILTDEQEYVDTAEVDAPALAEMMRTYKGRTSTSCPNISDWMAAYEGADEVYVVTITGTLSGAYNAALLAGEEYEQSHDSTRTSPVILFRLRAMDANSSCPRTLISVFRSPQAIRVMPLEISRT